MGWIQRFKNLGGAPVLCERDCNPAKLGTHFRGLEGLKKGAGGAEISSVCRQIALEAGRRAKTIGKDLVAVEMGRTGHNHCSHYSEDGAEVILVPDILSGTFSAKTGRRVSYRYITGAVAFLTLQDSRPYVLFGTVIVKHLDADIRGFFDNLSHEWTMKFVEHRVADRRILITLDLLR
jgi:hypothetical protein